MHFPVADNNWFSHLFLCLITLIPGNALPSINSSEAPPPVEMWLNLSLNPKFLAAAALSPPPITNIQSF